MSLGSQCFKKVNPKTWVKKTHNGCGFEIKLVGQSSFILNHVIKKPTAQRYIWQFSNLKDAQTTGSVMYRDTYQNN